MADISVVDNMQDSYAYESYQAKSSASDIRLAAKKREIEKLQKDMEASSAGARETVDRTELRIHSKSAAAIAYQAAEEANTWVTAKIILKMNFNSNN